jgi:hypothetical protein
MTAPAPRSVFVTALAWSFIAPAVLMIFVGVLQVLMLMAFAPDGADMLEGARALGLPAGFDFLFIHARLIAWAFLGFAVATLASGVGLLQRKYWGWLATVALLVLSIALNFAGLTIEVPTTASPAMAELGDLPPDLAQNVGHLMSAVNLLTKVLVFTLSALCAWLIYRLCTPKVRAEFKH